MTCRCSNRVRSLFFQVNRKVYIQQYKCKNANIAISVDRWTRHCLCLFQSPELIGEIVEWPTEGESLQGASTKSITRDRKGATDVHKTPKFVD